MPLVDATTLTFASIAVIVTVTPGADTLLTIKNTSKLGRKGGFQTLFGILVGGFIHASAAAVGLSAILLRSSDAYNVVKLLGGLYLAWLGIKSILNSFKKSADETVEISSERKPPRFGPFAEGFITNVLNPKVALFYIAFLPQFIRTSDPVIAKTYFLIALHYLFSFVWLGAIIFLVNSLASVIRKPKFQRALDRVSGVVFLVLGAKVALTKSS